MPTAILTWHSLDESGSPISISPRKFLAQLDALHKAGTAIVPLGELLHHDNAVALTFDDGFLNFYEQALPALLERCLPAALFVVNDFVGKHNNWPTQPLGVPQLPLLDWRQILEAKAAGIEIGAHTATHPYLYRLTHSGQQAEIIQAKLELEERLGQPVESFAYPYGASDARSRILVEEHFSRAVTTRFRYAEESAAPFDLPRLDVRSMGHPVWFSSLFTGVGHALVRARGFARAMRRFA